MVPWGHKESWDLGACLEIQDQKCKGFILFTGTEALDALCEPGFKEAHNPKSSPVVSGLTPGATDKNPASRTPKPAVWGEEG